MGCAQDTEMAIKSDNKQTNNKAWHDMHALEIFPCTELNGLKQTMVFLSFIMHMLFWYISDMSWYNTRCYA
jgi:hypothetical protein